MSDSTDRPRPELSRADGHWVGQFQAMASPCQVLMEVDDRRQARSLLSIVADEAWRIETKFSRYRADNIIHQINRSDGRDVEVDDETARLLAYADQLHGLSDGKFDVTAGVLRRAWKFDGGDRVPNDEAVQRIRRHVGWNRVEIDELCVRLEPGMEIDFGGIGKEYAADRASQMIAEDCERSCLINFGGDIVVTRPRRTREPWLVGVENPGTSKPTAIRMIRLTAGALATSGDAKRFLVRDGKRYGHILDPTTGWPVRDAPRSVTVAAGTCLDAGMLATFAMLRGRGAESFLNAQRVQHWVLR